jgi:nitrogen regulatory protein P-II 1
MKEISLFILRDDLGRVTEILRKHNVGGITFYEINGAGRTKREAVPEMVRAYMTGRTITPDYAKRTKVETIVSDSAVNQIVDDISNSLDQRAKGEAHGMIFIKEVSDAYELGTKQRGEAVLTSKQFTKNL